ncbi:MAG TPA: kelch repeat-containing protein [Stenomitos sp.]
MHGRSHKRIALGVALALVSGCAPRTASVLPPPTVSGLGAIELHLEGFGAAPRSTQLAPTFAKARLHFDGAAMPAEKARDAEFRLGASQLTVSNAPVGRNLVVMVEGLDSQDRVLPGARYGTVVDVTAGATVSAQVGPLTTPRAEVVLALLALDRTASRSVDQAFSARLDDDALQALLDSERARLGLVHPVLFDPASIARAIAATADPTATGPLAIPTDLSASVREPGELRVRVKGMPEGSKASVWLDDPISPKQQNLAAGRYDILPIAPGTWTLSAQSLDGTTLTLPVTVKSGLTPSSTEILLDMGRWDTVASMTKSLAASLCVPMTLGDVPSLVMVGGIGPWPTSPTDTAYAVPTCLSFDGSRMAALPSLPAPRSFASGAVVNGTLYAVGGLSEYAVPTRDVFAFDGRQWAAVATASAPVAGAASIAYGSTLYLFGGTLQDGGLAFDTDTGEFRDAPSMAVGRALPASAVYGDRLYVFGGGEQNTPLPNCQVFDPRTEQWLNLENMPVARCGARAIAYQDRIYVIGGVDASGRPSARVDVYDPATNTWSLFGALDTPRAVAAVGVVDDRIFVLGGCDGTLTKLLLEGSAADCPVPLRAVEVRR